jgi:hypothetical protein
VNNTQTGDEKQARVTYCKHTARGDDGNYIPVSKHYGYDGYKLIPHPTKGALWEGELKTVGFPVSADGMRRFMSGIHNRKPNELLISGLCGHKKNHYDEETEAQTGAQTRIALSHRNPR